MDLSIHIDRQHYIWTWMASNNINTQSHFLRRRYEKLSYFCREMGLESEMLVSILLSTKLVKDVKQTSGIPSVTCFTALKIAMSNAKKPGYPCWMSNALTWFKGKCTLFYSCFGNCRRLAYKISAYEVCMICPKLIAACDGPMISLC